MSELLYMNKYKYDVAHYGTIVSISLILLAGYCIYSSNNAVLSIILPLLALVILYSAYTSYSLKKDIEIQRLIHSGYDKGADSGSDKESDSDSDRSSVSSDPSSSDSEKTEAQTDFKGSIVSRKLSSSQYYKKFK
jgi:hypothetical protein